MADYNIYIRTRSTLFGSNPVTPWQFREGQENESGESSIGGFSPANAIRRGAAFAANPDSLISNVLHTTIGRIGLISVAATAAWNITDKAISMYQSFAAPASGDYKFQIDYSNFKQQIHNAFHPISIAIERQRNLLELRKQNLANEQQRLLLGGTFLNSPYGRYL